MGTLSNWDHWSMDWTSAWGKLVEKGVQKVNGPDGGDNGTPAPTTDNPRVEGDLAARARALARSAEWLALEAKALERAVVDYTNGTPRTPDNGSWEPGSPWARDTRYPWFSIDSLCPPPTLPPIQGLYTEADPGQDGENWD